ncbi:MAG TPA: hypothetical protein PK537_03845 [Candidatus Limiplasma sp.]|nr:hypothetical protein [Candidatus Limiplasma sp.]
MKRPVCQGTVPVVRCADCASPLRRDEIAITKRLISRGATQFFCIGCLARRLHVPEAAIEQKIQEYREMGCTLFSPL